MGMHDAKCLGDRKEGHRQQARRPQLLPQPLSARSTCFHISHCSKAAGWVSFAHPSTRSPHLGTKTLFTMAPAHNSACAVWAAWVNTYGHGIVQGVVVDTGAQRVIQHAIFKQLQSLRHFLVEVIRGLI